MTHTMIPIGTVGERSETVNDRNMASVWGSGTLPVYATPAMILLLEVTAMESVMPFLGEGEATVGTLLDVKHVSATPKGMLVTCRTEHVEIDRARLRFKVTVSDAKGEIGTGFHERFIVKCDKFMDRANAKSA